ncbi:MAG: hypothetical protein PHT33_16010 [bacterium]|nr:hypothetical protein [bacterium]
MRDIVLIKAQLIYLAAVAIQLVVGKAWAWDALRPDILIVVTVILLIRCETHHMAWLGLSAGLWHALYLSGPGQLMILSLFVVSVISIYIKNMAFLEHKLLPALLVIVVYATAKTGGIIAGFILHKHVGIMAGGVWASVILAVLLNQITIRRKTRWLVLKREEGF